MMPYFFKKNITWHADVLHSMSQRPFPVLERQWLKEYPGAQPAGAGVVVLRQSPPSKLQARVLHSEWQTPSPALLGQ